MAVHCSRSCSQDCQVVAGSLSTHAIRTASSATSPTTNPLVGPLAHSRAEVSRLRALLKKCEESSAEIARLRGELEARENEIAQYARALSTAAAPTQARVKITQPKSRTTPSQTALMGDAEVDIFGDPTSSNAEVRLMARRNIDQKLYNKVGVARARRERVLSLLHAPVPKLWPQRARDSCSGMCVCLLTMGMAMPWAAVQAKFGPLDFDSEGLVVFVIMTHTRVGNLRPLLASLRKVPYNHRPCT